MPEEQGEVAVFSQIGFGWLHSPEPVPLKTGGHVLEYRYIPSGLWMIDERKIVTQINLAANIYPTYDDYPAGLIAAEPAEGKDRLTKAGLAFYKSCPLYGRLHLDYPILTWTAFRPDGGVAFTVQSQRYEPMMTQVISWTPIELWAKLSFEPWAGLFEPHPTAGFWPMRMIGPRKPVQKEWTTISPVEHPETVPVAAVEERVEFPLGLYKTVYVSIADDKIADCAQYPQTETSGPIRGSMASRASLDSPFEWKEHWVFRYTVPAQYVGRAVQWMDGYEYSLRKDWAVRCAIPAYSPEMVDIKFSRNPSVDGFERLFFVLKPLEELDLSMRLKYELDVSHLSGPPL